MCVVTRAPAANAVTNLRLPSSCFSNVENVKCGGSALTRVAGAFISGTALVSARRAHKSNLLD